MYRISLRIISLCCLMLTALPAQAAEQAVNQLMQVIDRKLADPQGSEQAMQAGRNRALLCSYCHGEDGNSIKPEVPNLAGQNPVYLLDQINKFADGRRKNFVMNSLAREFTLDDKVNLAIYFSKQQVHEKKVDTQLAAKGRLIYSGTCSSCHGQRGKGNMEFARLAGQQPEYVKMTLKRFRNNARNPQQVDDTARHSTVMESIVKDFTDQEIEALAAYVALLPQD